MPDKTFAILTDIHSNAVALKKAISIIENHSFDQLICLGDYFALGAEPLETLKLLKSLDNCIFLRGNHDRYLIERLWEAERPSLEGMDPDDPICQGIVANEKWTAETIGKEGLEFISNLHIAHREIINSTLVEFTHAWYQRDDQPPSMQEVSLWKRHVRAAHPNIKQFCFVHGHTHFPRQEKDTDLKVFCQGATGLPFDEDPRGAIAFLTIGENISWKTIRFDYNVELAIKKLDEIRPPFYQNLMRTIKYAAVRNED